MQTLSFTNLPSGNYTLHVQIMDTAGIEVVREEVVLEVVDYHIK